jgi:hypothetical protein
LKIYSRFVFLLLLLLYEKVLPIYHASITVTAWKEKTRDQKNITSILPEKKRKGKKHSIFLQENVLNPSNQDNMSSIQVTSTTWKKEKVRERIEKLQDQKTNCIFACPSKMKITSLHFHVCLLVALSNTKDNKWLEIACHGGSILIFCTYQILNPKLHYFLHLDTASAVVSWYLKIK